MLYRLRAITQGVHVPLTIPAKFGRRQCSFAGYLDIPLFETPFFAAGVDPDGVVGGRFSGVVAPAGHGASDQAFIYRPDVAVLNVTPNVMPQADFGWEYCLTPYFAGRFDTPNHNQTAYCQRAPFGFNFPDPVLSALATVPNPGSAGGALCFEGIFEEFGTSIPLATYYDVGLLDGWNFIAYDPYVPSKFKNILGPNFDNGSGFNWPSIKAVTAKYPIFINGQLTSLGDDNMYFLCGALPTGAQQMQIVRWGNRPHTDINGLQSALTFDTASLNNQLANPGLHAGPPIGTRGTRFGFVIPSLISTTPNQASDIMLLSPTEPSYRLIRLVAQSPRASAFIANGGPFAFHIDQSAIAYAWDYNDGGRMYTSFGLDIPLNAPLIPPFQFAPLPCFSPCYPFFLTPAL